MFSEPLLLKSQVLGPVAEILLLPGHAGCLLQLLMTLHLRMGLFGEQAWEGVSVASACEDGRDEARPLLLHGMWA